MGIIGLNGFFLPLAVILSGGPFRSSELIVRDNAPIFINSATAECMHASNAVFAHFRGDIQLRFAERDGGVLFYIAGEKTCALGKNEKQEDISTEYPATAQFEAIDGEVADNPVGTWVDGSSEAMGDYSILEIDGRSQVGLAIFGTASHTNIAGSISTGDFLGLDDSSEGSRIHSSLGGDRESDCFLAIERIGKFLIVLDSDGNNRCGGQNVSFTGIYTSGKSDSGG